MIKDPQHPVGPAFARSADWRSYQLTQLTEAQRAKYDDIKKLNDQKLNRLRIGINETTEKLSEESLKRIKFDKVLSPPHSPHNTHMLRLGTQLKYQRQEFTDLRRQSIKHEVGFLKSLEQERPQQPVKQKPQAVRLVRPRENTLSTPATRINRTSERMPEQSKSPREVQRQQFRANATQTTIRRAPDAPRPANDQRTVIYRSAADRTKGSETQQKRDRNDRGR